jgi:preprotein translocase subunit YajC
MIDLLLMGDPQGGGNPFASFIFLGVIFFIFWFFIIRPQSKKQKEIEKKVTEMKKGDKVVTSGGMLGILHTTEDESVLVEVDKDVKVRILKTAIVDVNPGKNQ